MWSLQKAAALPIFWFVSALALAQEPEVVGRAVEVHGEVIAIDVNGNRRSLTRRSPFFVGETVVTSENAKALLRMGDSSLLALSCGSSFTIENYSLSLLPGDSVSLRLGSGRVRIISGSISELNAKAYSVNFNQSELNPSAADFDLLLDGDNKAYIAVYDGSASLTSQTTTLKLGAAADFDFAVTEIGFAPVGLRLQPPQMAGSPSPAGPGSGSLFECH